jgi:hypothetical protein
MLAVDHFMILPALGVGWQFGRWPEVTEVNRALKRGGDPSVPVTDIPKNESLLSLGWAPMIPLGMDRSDGVTTLLWPVTPQGAYFRTAYIPYRWGRNKLGMEFNIYILEHPNRREWSDDMADIVGILSHVHLGVLYQRKLAEKWQLNGRVGIGISNPYDFRDNSSGWGIPFSINTGLSAQYFFWKGFYAEAGLDMFVSLSYENHWMLHPGFGVGWQFNRDTETGLRSK